MHVTYSLDVLFEKQIQLMTKLIHLNTNVFGNFLNVIEIIYDLDLKAIGLGLMVHCFSPQFHKMIFIQIIRVRLY